MNKNTAKLHAQKYLEVNNTLYPQIQSDFEKIELEGSFSKDDIRMIKFSDKVNKTLQILKSIDTTELSSMLDEEMIKKVENKINNIYEDLLYIQKRLIGYTYADDLKVPIKKYIKNMGDDPSNYKNWASDPEELANKFIAMLIHPNNIDQYKNQIKRMALGTMSQREFRKIFDATKHKMIPASPFKFESFKEYNESV